MKISKVILIYLIIFLSNFVISADILSIPIKEIAYFLPFFLLFIYIFLLFKYKESTFVIFDEAKVFIGLFFIPIILSLVNIFLNLVFIDNYNYSADLFIGSIPRLFNYAVNLILCIVLTSRKNINFPTALNYFLIALAIFNLFGLWQLLNYYFSIPIIPFETRNLVHSVVGGVLKYRITSIAREPSFYAPLLAETFILMMFMSEVNGRKLKYTLIRILVLILMVFTLSPSAYIELIAIFFIMIFRGKWGYSIKIFSLSLIVFLCSFFYNYLNVFILYRIEHLGDSSRYLLLKTIILEMFNYGVNTICFGIGPKGLEYFKQTTKILVTNDPIHSSTNNIFIDLFVDTGLFGLVCIISLFYYLYRRTSRIKVSNIPIIFFFHLLLSSMYRANYSSIRFIVIVSILIFIINYYSSPSNHKQYETK